MRTRFRIMTAGAATAVGFLALTASPTIASAAAGPTCLEYTTYVACGAGGGTSPWTWTVRTFYDGAYIDPSSYSTTVPTTKVYCAHNTAYSISVSWVTNGVTYTSGTSDIQCNGSGFE